MVSICKSIILQGPNHLFYFTNISGTNQIYNELNYRIPTDSIVEKNWCEQISEIDFNQEQNSR